MIKKKRKKKKNLQLEFSPPGKVANQRQVKKKKENVLQLHQNTIFSKILQNLSRMTLLPFATVNASSGNCRCWFQTTEKERKKQVSRSSELSSVLSSDGEFQEVFGAHAKLMTH